jgi:hypothetical protein
MWRLRVDHYLGFHRRINVLGSRGANEKRGSQQGAQKKLSHGNLLTPTTCKRKAVRSEQLLPQRSGTQVRIEEDGSVPYRVNWEEPTSADSVHRGTKHGMWKKWST